MLTLAQEILLIALDDDTGKLTSLPDYSLDIVLAGALCMDLVFSKKISISSNGLRVLDTACTKDASLDYALDCLPRDEEWHSIDTCLQKMAGPIDSLSELICKQLVSKKILRKEEEKYFFFFTTTSYPMIDGTQEQKSRALTRLLLLEKPITSLQSRDIALIGLLSNGSLLSSLLKESEIELFQEKIESIKKLDIVHEAVRLAVESLQKSIAGIISSSRA